MKVLRKPWEKENGYGCTRSFAGIMWAELSWLCLTKEKREFCEEWAKRLLQFIFLNPHNIYSPRDFSLFSVLTLFPLDNFGKASKENGGGGRDVKLKMQLSSSKNLFFSVDTWVSKDKPTRTLTHWLWFSNRKQNLSYAPCHNFIQTFWKSHAFMYTISMHCSIKTNEFTRTESNSVKICILNEKLVYSFSSHYFPYRVIIIANNGYKRSLINSIYSRWP